MTAPMLYSAPRNVSTLDECLFYHTMDLPTAGLVIGNWDLRPNVAALLGNVPFKGARVLEIGPASGFLTFYMEQQGADLVCIEVPDDPGWDFVPFPESVLSSAVRASRREIMRRLKNSFWFAHRDFGSSAKLHYGDVYNLPNELGDFDIAVMASVLLHCQNPVRIIEQCAVRARTLIIADLLHPDLEGSPVCRLHPTSQNQQWDWWWDFSSDFFRQYLEVLGFSRISSTVGKQLHEQIYEYDLFTVVAAR